MLSRRCRRCSAARAAWPRAPLEELPQFDARPLSKVGKKLPTFRIGIDGQGHVWRGYRGREQASLPTASPFG